MSLSLAAESLLVHQQPPRAGFYHETDAGRLLVRDLRARGLGGAALGPFPAPRRKIQELWPPNTFTVQRI